MPPGPVPQDPGRDDNPVRVPPWPDWMDDPAYLAMRAENEDPGDLDLWEDPEDAPPPDVDEAELAAEAERDHRGSGTGGGRDGQARPDRRDGR